MPSHIIPLIEILTPDEYQHIDSFCTEHRGMNGIVEIAAFLRNFFSVPVDTDQEIVSGFTSDQSNLSGKATALCRPKDIRQCAAVMKACQSAGIPVTISGGRTNLTGSATPPSGLVLSLLNMTKPEVLVNEDSRSVRSPAGIYLEDLRNSVFEITGGRMFFPVDPTSRKEAMVGGAISCNASGFTPGEKGAMRPWVQSLSAVLMNGMGIECTRGEYLSCEGEFILAGSDRKYIIPVPRYKRPTLKNASGPYSSPNGVMDFVDLMTGSEGIFALIAGCGLTIADYPGPFLDLFFSLPREEDAINFRFHLANNFPHEFSILSAFEYFGPFCRRYMNHELKLFKAGHEVGIYLQIPCFQNSPENTAAAWLEILANPSSNIDGDAVMVLLSHNDKAVFFESRHSLPANSLDEARRRGSQTIMTDAVVPPDQFTGFLGYSHDLIRNADLDYLAFGHMGDCHLHFMILPQKGQIERALLVYDSIIEKSASIGGVYSGEHGTGKRKRADFIKCYGDEAVHQVKAAKRAFDPGFLLNRDNVVVYPSSV